MSKLFHLVILGLLLVSSAFAVPLSFDFPLQAIASSIAPNAASYVEAIVTVFVTESISTELVVSTVLVTLAPPTSICGTKYPDLASTTTELPSQLAEVSASKSAPSEEFSTSSTSVTFNTSTNPSDSPAGFYVNSGPTTTSPIATSAVTLNSIASYSSTTAYPTSSETTGAPSTPLSSSPSVNASCLGQDAACQGDITYYDSGAVGACGVNIDPSGNGIALPYEFMGTESNDNPICGRTLTIFNPATGESVQGTVMDKCQGCAGRSIDMMQTLMDALTNGQAETLGRVHNVTWWFN